MPLINNDVELAYIGYKFRVILRGKIVIIIHSLNARNITN